ncbi:hypothetical protein GCM10009665_53530 [Kitasatospora nipponensis]|uniref:ATPase BadF/BadG/BcrA/BcrD type domain-containing protein n=1 Tax=Kitasatospora nipponensis TaxID=258049 RepID=A0ABN1WMW2_9ACTN
MTGDGPLYLGLDVGGTRTRAVLHDRHGRELARAAAPGGNPAARGAGAALEVLGGAVAEVLRGRDPQQVGGCVLGLSGLRALPDRDVFAAACRTAFGLPGPVRLVSDAVVAFVAGSGAAAGTVLIAGTGTICCRISHPGADGDAATLDPGSAPGAADPVVTATAGGLGRALGGGGGGVGGVGGGGGQAHARPTDPLGRAVLAACGVTDPTALVRWAYDGPPHRLATLAPLVSELALAGDPAAEGLADAASARLVELIRAIHHPCEPIVLAGSVATTPGPIRDRLLARLRADGPPGPVGSARDPVAAAPPPPIRARLPARLRAAAPPGPVGSPDDPVAAAARLAARPG